MGDTKDKGALVLASRNGTRRNRDRGLPVVDRFYRPTILISLKDGIGKGSEEASPNSICTKDSRSAIPC